MQFTLSMRYLVCYCPAIFQSGLKYHLPDVDQPHSDGITIPMTKTLLVVIVVVIDPVPPDEVHVNCPEQGVPGRPSDLVGA